MSEARDYAEAIVGDVLADAQREMCVDYVTDRLEPVFRIAQAAREYVEARTEYGIASPEYAALVAAVEGK